MRNDEKPEKEVFKNLGWLNGWYSNPPAEFSACRAAGHSVSTGQMTETNLDPSHRGLDTRYRCHICLIEYHVDSSD